MEVEVVVASVVRCEGRLFWVVEGSGEVEVLWSRDWASPLHDTQEWLVLTFQLSRCGSG